MIDQIIEILFEEDNSRVVAIYGGGFKPPTKGHFSVVEKTLEDFPEIDELKVFVGGGVRDRITQDQSIKIWDIYNKYLTPKIDIESSIAPVKSIFDYSKEHPEEKIYWILGVREGNEDDLKDLESRTKSLEKYPNIEVKVITTDGSVSGTKARAALLSGDKEQFFKLIPDITDEEKEQVWNIFKSTIKESSKEKTKRLNKLKEEKELNVQDLAYQQIPGLLEKGINYGLAHFRAFIKSFYKWSGTKDKNEFFDFIESLNGEIKRVPLSSIIPSQKGKDYKNPSSEYEAEEFQKILDREKNVEDHRKEDFYPIVVNKRDNKIIDGNHRHYALSSINSPYAVILYIDVPEKYLQEASDPQAGTALPYGSGFAPVKELVTATEIICDNCGWKWKIADGGKDLYTCHKCGHDNTPKNDPFGLKEYAKEFVKEVFKEDRNIKEGMLSLSKYMVNNGMNIKPLPKVKIINNDAKNASDLLGKTAYYNPQEKSITLYTMNRHPKDVLRSFAHEMVHHQQNLEGRLNNINTTNTNEDGDLPEIEREAYEKGNMMLRNWEDSIKNS